MSGMPRPAALNKPRILQCKNKSGQVAAEDALVQALILAAKVLQEVGHSTILVGRARKIVREAAPREASRDLACLARSAAHASHMGT